MEIYRIVRYPRPAVPLWAQWAAPPEHSMSLPSGFHLILQPGPEQPTLCFPGLRWQVAPFLQSIARFFINFLRGLLICSGNQLLKQWKQVGLTFGWSFNALLQFSSSYYYHYQPSGDLKWPIWPKAKVTLRKSIVTLRWSLLSFRWCDLKLPIGDLQWPTEALR